MERERIASIIAELECILPVENAKVPFTQYGGGPDESKIVATENGYLRLGLEFLKAAFAPHSIGNMPSAVEVKLESILSEESTISFDWFERVDSLDQRFKPTNTTPFLGYVAALVFGLLIVMTVVGFVTTIRWLFT